MKKFLPFILFALPGCGALECIDAKFERDVKPIEQSFLVELQFHDREKMRMRIQCEEYYDAMCAERGNYWAIREVGLKSHHQTGVFQFTDPEYGQVTIPIPRCSNMVKGRETPMEHILPEINGDTYWLTSTDGEMRTYTTSKIYGPIKTVTVKLSILVDDVPLQ